MVVQIDLSRYWLAPSAVLQKLHCTTQNATYPTLQRGIYYVLARTLAFLQHRYRKTREGRGCSLECLG